MKGCGVMKQIGPGILENSEIVFSSSSAKAKKMYYNVLCAGHFYCDNHYHLVRDNYDSFLILYVADGTFTFADNGNYLTAEKGDTIVLDCYRPHEYFTSDYLESFWVHIEGVNCCDFYDEIVGQNGNIIRQNEKSRIKERIIRLFKGIERSFAESDLSLEVYKLLLELQKPVTIKAKDEIVYSENIRIIKEHISTHLNEKITVSNLAELAHMSPTHFSRVFKSQTGFSPYDYVVISRLNKAKEYLLTSDMSVAEIAYETGFNSEANFVYCFTNNEGVSPGKFRKLKF